jgi:hypothetical protein
MYGSWALLRLMWPSARFILHHLERDVLPVASCIGSQVVYSGDGPFFAERRRDLIQPAGPRTRARAVGRFVGRRARLAQPEKGQDREDDHDEADEIDDTVHAHLLPVGSRSASRS